MRHYSFYRSAASKDLQQFAIEVVTKALKNGKIDLSDIKECGDDWACLGDVFFDVVQATIRGGQAAKRFTENFSSDVDKFDMYDDLPGEPEDYSPAELRITMAQVTLMKACYEVIIKGKIPGLAAIPKQKAAPPKISKKLSPREQVFLLQQGAKAWNEWLEKYEGDINLSKADLSGVNLRGVRLPFAKFKSADLSNADISHSVLEEIDFQNADLSRANLESSKLNWADLRGANLSGTNFRRAALYMANLTSATFRNAIFYNAAIVDADLSGTNLKGVDFRKAKLEGSNFGGANLYSADLEGASLRWANLRGANLSSANLSSANLQKAEWEPHSRHKDLILNGARYNENTKFPRYFHPEEHYMKFVGR